VRPRATGTVPRAGARAFLDLDRVDLVWLLVLVAGSFVLRFGSPIFPNAFSHPLTQAPVTAFTTRHRVALSPPRTRNWWK